MPTHCLNVDLEIESHHNLQPLVDAFDDKAFNLYVGKVHGHYLATFEVHGMGAIAEPDPIISQFCTLIKSFDQEARQLWDSAFLKVFDIGYESGLEPRCYSSPIRFETIEQIAALGASLRVTIYPPHQE